MCFLLAVLFYNYIGHWFVKTIINGTVGKVVRIILWPLKKCLSVCKKCCCGTNMLEGKEFNPPVSKEFLRGYPKGTSAAPLSSNAGWVLTKGEGGTCFHTKEWDKDGEVDRIRHRAGDQKRTWEAMRDSQLHTYNIRQNETYADAMIAKDALMEALEAAGGPIPEPEAGSKNTAVVPVS